MSPFHADQPDRGSADPFAETDALGLGASLPRPGWVVIDAVRERAFTGEVICATDPAVRLFSDRGLIYVAEREADGLLGERLVAAGALDADQLARGAVRLGEVEHLGRLFDRDPSIDRDKVLVATELLTEDCLGWLAAERVTGAVVIPYRHHASGIHRWERADDEGGFDERDVTDAPAVAFAAAPPSAPVGSPFAMPAPGASPVALPAPSPAALGVTASHGTAMPPPPPSVPTAPSAPLPPLAPAAPPAPPTGHGSEVSIVFGEPADQVDQETISWSEPGWLDQPLPGDADPFLVRPLSLSSPEAMPASPSAPPAPAGSSLLAGVGDWIDRLGIEGLPERGADPLARPVALPPLGAEAIDRFEVIWPSGEIDEQFGSQVTETYPNPDIDRAGPTARMVRDGGMRVADADVQVALGSGVADIEQWLASETVTAPDDDVVLAVRRTVAGIDVAALSQRPTAMSGPAAPVAPPAELTAPPVPQPVVAATARMTVPCPSGGSVFDTVPGTPAAVPTTQNDVTVSETPEAAGAERTSALKRLIGSLRRR